MSKPKPHVEGARKGKLAKGAPKFVEAFALTATAALVLLAAARFGWLDAWQWPESKGPSIYVAAGALAAIVALAVAWRSGGKPAFWGAATVVIAGVGVMLYGPLMG
jgi:hypothetical protein